MQKEYYGMRDAYEDNVLSHHGILGQKWGIRRFQNPDGSLTPAGRERYNKGVAKELLSDYRSTEGRFGRPYYTSQKFKDRVNEEADKVLTKEDKDQLKKLHNDLSTSMKAYEKMYDKYYKEAYKLGEDDFNRVAKETPWFQELPKSEQDKMREMNAIEGGWLIFNASHPDIAMAMEQQEALTNNISERRLVYEREIADRFLGKTGKKSVGNGYQLRDVVGNQISNHVVYDKKK